MSAAENLALMQRIFAAAAEGDGGLYVKHLADDVTMTITGRNSWSQTFHGKAALMRDLYGYLGSLCRSPRRSIPWNFIAGGDHVAVEVRGEMLTKAGAPYENEYCLVYRLRDGRIVEAREYCDFSLTEAVLGPYPADRRLTPSAPSPAGG